MGAFNSLVGSRFGKLLVIERMPNEKGNTIYHCECECGVSKNILAKNLVNGRTKSCGCIRNMESHGFASSGKKSTYRTWVSMKQRCLNPNATGYERYGARGISVCERWLRFTNFYADMGERPEGMTLDRINSDGNYEPSNCRWATMKEQANNRREKDVLIIDTTRGSLV